MTDVFDQLFRSGRVSRFLAGEDPSWVPQEDGFGPGKIDPQGFIADGVVNVDQLAANAVTAAKIAAGAITVGKLSVGLNDAVLASWTWAGSTSDDPWSLVVTTTGTPVKSIVAVSDAETGQYVLRVTGGSPALASVVNIPFDPAGLYRVHFRVRQVTAVGGAPNSQAFLGLAGVAADGTTLVNVSGANAYSSQHYVAAAAVALTAGAGWVDYVGYVRGTAAGGSGTAHADSASPGVMHSSVRYIRPIMYLNYTSGTGQVEVDTVSIQRIDNTGVSNSDGSVTIDSSGITIRNGKLTLQDENGSTVATASGFSGGWLDFIRLGLYNGRLLSGVVGTIANGRSSACPYWTFSDITGTVVASFLSGGGVKFATFSALGSKKRLVSDIVPVRPGVDYAVPTTISATWADGALLVAQATILWYQADGTTSAGTSTMQAISAGGSPAGSVTNLSWEVGAATAPAAARYAKLQVDVSETLLHSVTNFLTLATMGLVEAPPLNLHNVGTVRTRYFDDVEVQRDLYVDRDSYLTASVTHSALVQNDNVAGTTAVTTSSVAFATVTVVPGRRYLLLYAMDITVTTINAGSVVIGDIFDGAALASPPVAELLFGTNQLNRMTMAGSAVYTPTGTTVSLRIKKNSATPAANVNAGQHTHLIAIPI